jgi:hypothetical protein
MATYVTTNLVVGSRNKNTAQSKGMLQLKARIIWFPKKITDSGSLWRIFQTEKKKDKKWPGEKVCGITGREKELAESLPGKG